MRGYHCPVDILDRNELRTSGLLVTLGSYMANSGCRGLWGDKRLRRLKTKSEKGGERIVDEDKKETIVGESRGDLVLAASLDHE